MEEKFISFKTCCNTGDVIYSLPGIKQVCLNNNAKANYFIHIDQTGHYYPGAEHPYGNKMQTNYSFDMIAPLMFEQYYISDVKRWNGENILVDLDEIRNMQIGMPNGNISRWYFARWPDMTTDLSKPWIKASGLNHHLDGKILINRTSRYHGGWINYFFLKKYQDRLVFVGLESEAVDFMKEWGFDFGYLKVNNFLELANAMASCKFFIGNQSTCFAIAEAMKIPRALEVCPWALNVIPAGGDAFDYHHQGQMEMIINYLDTKKWT